MSPRRGSCIYARAAKLIRWSKFTGSAGEPSVALDQAGIAVFRDNTFLAAGPASERNRSPADVSWLGACRMKAVYVWCDCGSPNGPRHYYTGFHCPFSGWVAPYVAETIAAVTAVEQSGKPLTIESLAEVRLSDKALARVLAAEFPSMAQAPSSLGVDAFGKEP
jgi:hypothetical protein